MIINRNRVILSNRPYLPDYIRDYTRRDNDDTTVAKGKDKIFVEPDGQEATIVTVRFVTDLIFAVSDGEPDVELIRKVLASLAGGAIGPGGGLQETVLNGITLAGDITGAVNALYQTGTKADTIQFIVPIQVTREGCTYTMSARLFGSSVTTDSDAADEKANVDLFYVRLGQEQAAASDPAAGGSGQDPSRPVNADDHLNEGTEKTLSISLRSIDAKGLPKGTIPSAATVQYNVRTDGAFWHDTVNAVRIRTVEIVYSESCPPPPVPDPNQQGPEGDANDQPGDGGPDGEAPGEKRPVRFVENIGDATARRLEEAGIASLDDLAAMPETMVVPGVSPARLASFRAMAGLALAYPQLTSNDVELLVEGLGLRSRDDVQGVAFPIDDAVLESAIREVRLPFDYDPQRVKVVLGTG